MQHLLSAYIIFSICYFGWAVGRFLTRKHTTSLSEQLFLSISLGTFLYTLSLFLVHAYLNVAISLQTVLALATVELIASVSLLAVTKQPVLPSVVTSFKSLQKRSAIEKVLMAVIAFIVLSTLVQNIFWPVTDWDALALYDFRARVVAETGSFDSGVALGYFLQYPPFTSLLHTTIYLTGAVYAKIWYTLLYVALISGIYAVLRKRTSTLLATFGALMIAVNPLIFEHSIMAYTNLSYTLFLAMGTIYIWEWFRTKQNYCGIVGGLLIAAATWVRITEPLWMIGVGLILLISVLLTAQQKKWRPMLTGIFALGSIFLTKQIWSAFLGVLYAKHLPTVVEAAANSASKQQSTLSIPFLTNAFNTILGFTSYFAVFSQQPPDVLLSRAIAVTMYLQAYVVPILAMYLLPFVVVGILVLRERSYRWLEWGTVLSYIGLISIGTYLFSFSDNSWDQIGGSAQRMSMFLIPLVLFLILEHPLWLNNKK